MKYKLQDLIDMEHFQNLQDRLNEIYSFPSSIIDNEGNILTATAWQDICTQFHRKNKDCEKLCIQSDLYIKDHIHEANPAVTYRCPHGLVDNATPIIIDGFHYGNFFTGQFFLEEPDMEFFRTQAKKYQFDEDAYLKAVKRVPIWTQKQLNSYLFFIKGLIAIISESGLKNLKEVENRKLIESSEKRHRSILKSAMDGYWLTDTEGRLLEVNDAYCRMSGYTEKELLTMCIPDLEAIENPQLAAEHMQKIISQGSDRFESIHRRKDGTVFTVEVSTQFHPEQGGQCVCFLRDITDQKKGEDALKESEEKYRLLVETANDAIFIAQDGIIKFPNPKTFEILGYSEIELSKVPFINLIHHEDRGMVLERHLQRLKGDQPPQNYSFRIINKAGNQLWVQINVTLIKWDGRSATINLLRDITESKQAEEELTHSHELMRYIIEHNRSAIAVFGRDLKYIYVSQRYLDDYKVKEKDVIGKHHYDVFPDIPQKWKDVHQKSLAGEVLSAEEDPFYREDGSVDWTRWECRPWYESNGSIGGIIIYNEVINERKKVEESLRESEHKLAAHLQNTPIGALSWDLNFKAIEWNPAAEAIFGYSKAEAMGKHVTELILPEELKKMVDGVYRDLISGKGGTRSTNENITKDGRRIICDWYNTILKDAAGKVIGAASLVQDITERKQSELALISSEHKWRNILVNIPQIGVTLDTKAKVIFANAYFLQLTGWKEQEVIGQDWFDMFIPEHVREEVRKVFLTVLSQKNTAGSSSYENEIIDRSGMLLNVAWSNALTKDVHGNVIDVTCLGVDLTELQRSEQSLKKSEEKYRSMMESMKDTSYICSPDLYIEYMNPAMIDRVGTDATGKLCYKAIYDRDEKCSWCIFDQIKKGETVDYEVTDPKNNRYYSVSNSPIFHDDGTTSKLTIFHDITEIKDIEAQLRQSRKMESIGTLAGGIAHDFNNIMAIIIGNTELALDDVPKWNSAHSNLEEIKKASLRAKNIVKQLLSFSRKSDQKLQPIQIVSVIKDALQFLRSTIPTTINIHRDIKTTDELILSDPTQINQIIMNLCINASHAMEQTGGDLTVTVERVILDDISAKDYPDLKSGDHVMIMVSDSGPGIDSKIIDQIFDSYFTTKEIGKGSGMGLAVVHGIVKSHGGAIAVDSSFSKGTKFTILFPLATEKPMVETQTLQGIPGGNETILFVDDEISIVKMVKRMFERLGYKIETAQTIRKVLDK